jgi:hypothetical protein
MGEQRPRAYLARIKREQPIGGMRPIVTLILIHDGDPVELAEGDELVSVVMQIDPWEPREGAS